MNKKNQKGFTLVELIVVIAIVAILAAVGIVGYTQFISNARETAAQSELDQVVNVLRTEASTDNIEELDFTGGKLVFSKIDQARFEEIMELYADGFEGTFTLNKDGLHYELNNAKVTAKNVTTDENQDEVTYQQAEQAEEEEE